MHPAEEQLLHGRRMSHTAHNSRAPAKPRHVNYKAPRSLGVLLERWLWNSRCVVWISSMANGSSHLLSLLNVAFLPLCLSTGVRECRKDILAKTSRRAKMSSKRVKELSDSLPPAVSWAYKPTVTLFTNMFNPKSPFASNYFYTWTVGFTSISLKNENQRAGLSRMIISLNKPA